jgi:hypothetical protein
MYSPIVTENLMVSDDHAQLVFVHDPGPQAGPAWKTYWLRTAFATQAMMQNTGSRSSQASVVR